MDWGWDWGWDWDWVQCAGGRVRGSGCRVYNVVWWVSKMAPNGWLIVGAQHAMPFVRLATNPQNHSHNLATYQHSNG